MRSLALRILISCTTALLVSGCATELQRRETVLSDGKIVEVYYVKVAPDGTELRHGQYISNDFPWRVNGEYTDGRKSGTWRTVSVIGEVIVDEYEADGIRFHSTAYYGSGNKWYEADNLETMRHGKWRKWNIAGWVEEAGGYSNGLRSGVWTFYHDNGTPRKQCTYVEDTLDGCWQEFSRDGRKLAEGVFRKGKRHGSWRAWFENGVVKMSGDYVDGEKEGLETAYYSNGNVHSVGRYSNGKKDGVWEFYTQEGVLQKRGSFREGREVED